MLIELNEDGLTLLNGSESQVAFGLFLTSAAENENSYFGTQNAAELVIGGYP